MTKAKALYSYGRYEVRVIHNHVEEGFPQPVDGYGIFNTETGIQEISTTLLANAIVWARNCEDNLARVEREPDQPEAEWQKAVAADASKAN